jgi:hypothetical protein
MSLYGMREREMRKNFKEIHREVMITARIAKLMTLGHTLSEARQIAAAEERKKPS